MNHVTVLKIMIEGTASFSYHTFCYPASFTVMAGPMPYVAIQPHGDRRGDTIPITGDLLILNGNGDLIAQASYAELIASATTGQQVVNGRSERRKQTGVEHQSSLDMFRHGELSNPVLFNALEQLYQNKPEAKYVVGLYPEANNGITGYIFANSAVQAILHEDKWTPGDKFRVMESLETSSKNWLINSPNLYFYRAKWAGRENWTFNLFQSPGTTMHSSGLTSASIMHGWGEQAATRLTTLIEALINHYGPNLNWRIGVMDHNAEDNKLHAIVYIPHWDNQVQQVIGIVKEDMGAFIGAMTGKALEELNVGADGSFFGHYGDLKLYQLDPWNNLTFVEAQPPVVPS